MAIILDANSRICVQGITGIAGRTHVASMLNSGAKVVAGVSPGHHRETVCGIPVFDSCLEAVADTGANMSICLVRGSLLLDAVTEAVDAGIGTVVCTAEDGPLQDLAIMRRYTEGRGGSLIGPNSNGITSPGIGTVGFFPDELSMRGSVGVVSRSGSLSYGALVAMQAHGIGQSTVLSIGGGEIRGLGFIDCLKLFERDPDTSLVVLLGEIGGTEEEDTARYLLSRNYSKPIVGLVVGRVAPEGVTMGHAGAIAFGSQGGWKAKNASLSGAGVTVVRTLDELGFAVSSLASEVAGTRNSGEGSKV